MVWIALLDSAAHSCTTAVLTPRETLRFYCLSKAILDRCFEL
ncbi:hypothetical protein Alg130_05322 [Pyrenophora tritici-repentis]|nr:hypothetical protein Alg215_03440 [Pyrenophora tritici-repentis]KAI0584123.1 hypothetical protein Alg130_05322 [Pyrenophora tritici-repentis]